MDPQKRIQLIKEIQLYLADKIYLAPLANGYGRDLATPKLRDYRPRTSSDIGDILRYVWMDE